ncbi:hypothetical protein BK129_07750 [Paenibacillus amylolyticus]|nr:hypothetical protein C161_15466 [Paenibacillus sp. FSL R5-192]OMF07680.1 hypothetical protein BK129_07750 [Paenibacillus amylolyticus]
MLDPLELYNPDKGLYPVMLMTHRTAPIKQLRIDAFFIYSTGLRESKCCFMFGKKEAFGERPPNLSIRLFKIEL